MWPLCWNSSCRGFCCFTARSGSPASYIGDRWTSRRRCVGPSSRSAWSVWCSQSASCLGSSRVLGRCTSKSSTLQTASPSGCSAEALNCALLSPTLTALWTRSSTASPAPCFVTCSRAPSATFAPQRCSHQSVAQAVMDHSNKKNRKDWTY